MAVPGKRELVEFSRRYAVELLNFNVGHSFEAESDGTYACWALQWSPRTELRLYNDDFDSKSDAMKKSMDLLEEYDVMGRPLEAYGGAGTCPVTKSLLSMPSHEIASTVVHERFHDKVSWFRKMEENLMIEESAADVLGINESIKIMRLLYGLDSQEYKEAVACKERNMERAKAIRSLVEDLDSLYISGKPRFEILEEKKRMLDDFNLSYKELVGTKIDSNAVLCSFYTYDALWQLADDIYMSHNFRAKEIFVGAMKVAKFLGFEAGVDELLKYSSLDKKDYKRAINVYRK